MFFASLHGHPAQEYPYFLGYDDETGEGQGEGCNANYPLRWGTEWPAYETALDDALARIRRYRPQAIVVSLGVDTFKDDPISKFKLDSPDYFKIGRKIAALGLPTLFIMKLSARGYHRVLRVARTLADLEAAPTVRRIHIAEALAYRRIAPGR